jgi:hypothetical protein
VKYYIDNSVRLQSCIRNINSGDSTESMELVPLSDVGSHNGAGASEDESASMRCYFLGLRP